MLPSVENEEESVQREIIGVPSIAINIRCLQSSLQILQSTVARSCIRLLARPQTHAQETQFKWRNLPVEVLLERAAPGTASRRFRWRFVFCAVRRQRSRAILRKSVLSGASFTSKPGINRRRVPTFRSRGDAISRRGTGIYDAWKCPLFMRVMRFSSTVSQLDKRTLDTAVNNLISRERFFFCNDYALDVAAASSQVKLPEDHLERIWRDRSPNI